MKSEMGNISEELEAMRNFVIEAGGQVAKKIYFKLNLLIL